MCAAGVSCCMCTASFPVFPLFLPVFPLFLLVSCPCSFRCPNEISIIPLPPQNEMFQQQVQTRLGSDFMTRSQATGRRVGPYRGNGQTDNTNPLHGTTNDFFSFFCCLSFLLLLLFLPLLLLLLLFVVVLLSERRMMFLLIPLVLLSCDNSVVIVVRQCYLSEQGDGQTDSTIRCTASQSIFISLYSFPPILSLISPVCTHSD